MMSKTTNVLLFYQFTIFKRVSTSKVEVFFPDNLTRLNSEKYLLIGQTV
jgi:hypothetical protein